MPRSWRPPSSASSVSSRFSTATPSARPPRWRFFLFFFLVLWVASLQVILFAWKQLPCDNGATFSLRLSTTEASPRSGITSSKAVPISPDPTPPSCLAYPHHSQVCSLLYQVWQNVPEPVNRTATAQRRVLPNVVVRGVSSSSGQSLEADESPETVVLATHLGVSKLDVLRIQVRWWSGPVSASLYVREEADVALFLDFLEDYRDELAQVTFHVVLEKTALAYPHNILRNLALQYLGEAADYFVAADVDFIPTYGAGSALTAWLRQPDSVLRKELRQQRLFVLPAFERFQTFKNESVTEAMLPRTKADVQRMFKAKQMIGFHMAGSPMGHGPTKFFNWLKNETKAPTDGGWYAITYKNIFEPYVLGYRPGLPRCWEAFRGYGYNKFSWFFELNKACYSFGVLRDYYLVHMNHPMTLMDQKKQMTEWNRGHWQQFKDFLSKRYRQTCQGTEGP